MDHPKCRLCGERHRLGDCKFGKFGVAKRGLSPKVRVNASMARAAAVKAPAPRKVKAKAAKPPVNGHRRGRPRIGEEGKTIAARKPWEKLGMSERTWWRRQAEKQK